MEDFFGLPLLGQYYFANRVLNYPLSLISSAIDGLFREKCSNEISKTGECKDTFEFYIRILFVIAISFMVPFALISPRLFPTLFGQQWILAGKLIQAITVLSIVKFVSGTLSYVWILRNKQKLDFIWQIFLFLIVFITFYTVNTLKPDISLYHMLIIYSFVTTTWYTLAIIGSRKFSSGF